MVIRNAGYAFPTNEEWVLDRELLRMNEFATDECRPPIIHRQNLITNLRVIKRLNKRRLFWEDETSKNGKHSSASEEQLAFCILWEKRQNFGKQEVLLVNTIYMLLVNFKNNPNYHHDLFYKWIVLYSLNLTLTTSYLALFYNLSHSSKRTPVSSRTLNG